MSLLPRKRSVFVFFNHHAWSCSLFALFLSRVTSNQKFDMQYNSKNIRVSSHTAELMLCFGFVIFLSRDSSYFGHRISRPTFMHYIRASYFHLASVIIYLWSDRMFLMVFSHYPDQWQDNYSASHFIGQYGVIP